MDNKLNQDKLTQDKLNQDYINQMSDREKVVLKIAKEHLETSFCLEQSIGYKMWLSKNVVSKNHT